MSEKPKIPVPTLVQLQRMDDDGNWVAVGTENLLYPHRYAERLAAHGKTGRAVALDDHLQPTGTVYEPVVERCPVCERTHVAPYDGTCLL